MITPDLYQLITHSMEQSPYLAANGSQPVKKFPAFYGTRSLITTFTTARHLSISTNSILYFGHIMAGA